MMIPTLAERVAELVKAAGPLTVAQIESCGRVVAAARRNRQPAAIPTRIHRRPAQRRAA